MSASDSPCRGRWVGALIATTLAAALCFPGCGGVDCNRENSRLACTHEALSIQQECSHVCLSIQSACNELCMPDMDCVENCTADSEACITDCTDLSEELSGDCGEEFG